MGKLTFVLGGARSGKSNYAEKLALEFDSPRIYLATALPSDKMMEYRIKRHQKQRLDQFQTIERYNNFNQLQCNPNFIKTKVILIDCLTLLVTNQMMDYHLNWNTINPERVNDIEKNIRESILNLLDIIKEKEIIIVSNEVGLGIVPSNMFANYFRDILGRINQLVASKADNVIFMIAGIPNYIKGDKK